MKKISNVLYEAGFKEPIKEKPFTNTQFYTCKKCFKTILYDGDYYPNWEEARSDHIRICEGKHIS